MENRESLGLEPIAETAQAEWGEVRWVHVTSRIRSDRSTNGEVVGLVGSALDVLFVLGVLLSMQWAGAGLGLSLAFGWKTEIVLLPAMLLQLAAVVHKARLELRPATARSRAPT